MANNNISERLQIFDKRVFLDIASKGCGSNCIYCFTKHPEMRQELLPWAMIYELCQKIKELNNCSEIVLSLCPNTEPLKSKQARDLVLKIVSELYTHVKYIQIATKEYIPIDFLESLNSISSEPQKIRISISLPYISFTDIIEPGAASVHNRLKNIENIHNYPGLRSILYLRPFNKQMIKDREKYAEIICKFKPDDICLGAEFVPKVSGEQLCTFMYDHDLAPDIFSKAELFDVFEFAEYLRTNTACKILFSSICHIAAQSDYGCILHLHNYDERYCLDCNLRKCDLL